MASFDSIIGPLTYNTTIQLFPPCKLIDNYIWISRFYYNTKRLLGKYDIILLKSLYIRLVAVARPTWVLIWGIWGNINVLKYDNTILKVPY